MSLPNSTVIIFLIKLEFLMGLSIDQITFFKTKGYLRLPAIFSPEMLTEMEKDHSWMNEHWATKDQGWTGDWRKKIMDQKTEAASKLHCMHDLHLIAGSWNRALNHPPLIEAMVDLLGENVELHHSTMHSKPPGTGHPFPMHQDWAFYPHQNDRYVDVLVHLDDTCHDNGEIRFVEASHLQGPIDHIVRDSKGTPCTPHLPVEDFPLAESVAVPAKRGDVVLFNINTIHGSHVNTTAAIRRLVRIGYRAAENQQLAGQSLGRQGPMVAGRRPVLEKIKLCENPHDMHVYMPDLSDITRPLHEFSRTVTV